MSDTDQTEDPMRAMARSLFAPDPDETDEPDEQQKPPGHVPGEGTNPTGEAHDMRAYVKALFYPDPPTPDPHQREERPNHVI